MLGDALCEVSACDGGVMLGDARGSACDARGRCGRLLATLVRS